MRKNCFIPGSLVLVHLDYFGNETVKLIYFTLLYFCILFKFYFVGPRILTKHKKVGLYLWFYLYTNSPTINIDILWIFNIHFQIGIYYSKLSGVKIRDNLYLTKHFFSENSNNINNIITEKRFSHLVETISTTLPCKCSFFLRGWVGCSEKERKFYSTI